MFRYGVDKALLITTIIFTFVPEICFDRIKLLDCSYENNIILNRVIVFCGILLIIVICRSIYLYFRKEITIKENNYCIKVKYGNIFDMKNCKKVIPFDECFTTVVGESPWDINPKSICGQFLLANPINDIKKLIDTVALKPTRSRSKFRGEERYTSGKLIPQDDYLLMAFAKLDEAGLGRLTYDEYLESLMVLWQEIDKYYGQLDVCIPILGSGVTRINDTSLSQQKLLEIMIMSYKLSSHKIKLPCTLYIVCKKTDDFSLSKICV